MIQIHSHKLVLIFASMAFIVAPKLWAGEARTSDNQTIASYNPGPPAFIALGDVNNGDGTIPDVRFRSAGEDVLFLGQYVNNTNIYRLNMLGEYALHNQSVLQLNSGNLQVGDIHGGDGAINTLSLMTGNVHRLFINADGNVAIGNNNTVPGALLHLHKDGTAAPLLMVQGNAIPGNRVLKALTLRHVNTPSAGETSQALDVDFTMERGDTYVQTDAARIRVGKENDFRSTGNIDSYLAFYTARDGNFQEKMRLKSDGELTVAGNIAVAGNTNITGTLNVTTSIKAKIWTVAPDYVFEKDYKLASLQEVESFVKKNKHLPEVPSAKTIKDKGLDLAEMNLLLLKKVEELTLHAIRQEKENKALAKKMAALETRLSSPLSKEHP